MITLGDALHQALTEPWTGFVSLRSMERKVAKNGTTFFRCTFSDGTVPVAANIFEDRPWFKPLADQTWRVGDHLKIEGRVSTHAQFGRQIEISRIRLADAKDKETGYLPEKLMDTAPVDLEVYWQEIQTTIASLEPEPLRNTLTLLFTRHEQAFRRASAAKQAHHAYYGGLLHHTGLMIRQAKALMQVPDFPRMNPSLVLAGILLHDLGKVEEMVLYPHTEYTESGSLLGHVSIVLGWLDHAAGEAGFSGPLFTHLKHIILSHHGLYEFGAAVLPQTQEALFVHMVDQMDAKLQMVSHALQHLDDKAETTEKLWALENRVFRRTPDC